MYLTAKIGHNSQIPKVSPEALQYALTPIHLLEALPMSHCQSTWYIWGKTLQLLIYILIDIYLSLDAIT